MLQREMAFSTEPDILEMLCTPLGSWASLGTVEIWHLRVQSCGKNLKARSLHFPSACLGSFINSKHTGRINEVTKFLNGDGLTSPQSPSRPGIFCNDAFATYAPWEEPVKDENRNRIPYEIDENGDVTRWWTIREVFPKQVDNLDRRNPFWIESLNGYEFDVNGFDTLCGKASVFAATSFPAAQIEHDDIKTADFERNIWFCPRTWSKPEVNSPHRVPNLSTLLTDDGYPKGGTGEGLDRFATISCTLYHELYHLTDYQGTTHDRGGECKYFTSFPSCL